MILEIEAKSLLQHVRGKRQQWFDLDYTMNIYRGCSHGCIYCDSRSECYRIPIFEKVAIKKNAIPLLSKELLSKRKKGVIGIGAMSDPYNPFEKKLEITRQALQMIHDTHFGLALATKSDLILRDIDILQKIHKKQSVLIKITITCAEDALSKQIEPFVSPSSKRFAIVKQMHEAGIFCGVLLMPILPFINDTPENIRSLVRQAAKAHAKFIYPMFGVTLRDQQRSYFYQQLERIFPSLVPRYQQTFQQQYGCWSPRHKELRQVFIEECEKHQILYTMPAIIEAYKKKQPTMEQLSFPGF